MKKITLFTLLLVSHSVFGQSTTEGVIIKDTMKNISTTLMNNAIGATTGATTLSDKSVGVAISLASSNKKLMLPVIVSFKNGKIYRSRVGTSTHIAVSAHAEDIVLIYEKVKVVLDKNSTVVSFEIETVEKLLKNKGIDTRYEIVATKTVEGDWTTFEYKVD